MKKCPFCAEEIQLDAIKCKHCGEFLNKTSSLDKTKNLLDQGLNFIKEKNEQRLEKKYAHLFTPTENEPMELNGTKVYKDYIEESGRKYKLDDIMMIFFEEHTKRTNGVKTKEEVYFVLYFGETNEKGNIEMFKFNMSYSTAVAMIRDKLIEKIIFIKDYISKRTFDIRLKGILKDFKDEGYFPFAGTNIAIRSNGDFVNLTNKQNEGNIFEKIEQGLLEYKNMKWGSYKISNYDPYNMIIYKNSKPTFKILGLDFNAKITIQMSNNQDLNDYIIQSILEKKPVLY